MTIKLEPHITMGQVNRWIKSGAKIEVYEWNVFIVAEGAIMTNEIGKANKDD